MDSRGGLIHLTPGEWFILGYLAERMDGVGEITWQISVDSGLATADAMLRRLREAGYAISKRLPDASNRRIWHITVQGREALDKRRWAVRSLDVMERDLKQRLSKRGWDYARRYARSELHLTHHLPPEDGLGVAERVHVQRMVRRYLDGATGCR